MLNQFMGEAAIKNKRRPARQYYIGLGDTVVGTEHTASTLSLPHCTLRSGIPTAVPGITKS